MPVTECIRSKSRNTHPHRIWNKTGFALWESIFTFLQGLILQVVLLEKATLTRTQELAL